MEDLTRFGLVLVGFPLVVFCGGLVIGLAGRLVKPRAPHDRS